VIERQERENGREDADLRVQRLVRDLVLVINAGAAEQREHLRDMAVRLLRDEVEVFDRTVEVREGSGTFNPFGIAIPLVLVGGVMLILFPPVGLVLFAGAGVMVVWGVAVVLLSRR
jgi:hypothetical protein